MLWEALDYIHNRLAVPGKPDLTCIIHSHLIITLNLFITEPHLVLHTVCTSNGWLMGSMANDYSHQGTHTNTHTHIHTLIACSTLTH